MKLTLPDAIATTSPTEGDVGRAFSADLYQLVCDSHDPNAEVERGLGSTIAQYTGAIGVFLFDAANSSAPLSILYSRIDDIPQNVFRWSVSLANRALATGHSQSEASRNENATFHLSVSPVSGAEDLCLVVFHQSEDVDRIEKSLESAAPALLSVRQAQGNLARQLAALQDLVSRTELADTRELACAQVANSLSDYLSVDHVAIAVADDKARLRILAVSDQEHLDTQSEQYRLAMALLQEAVCRHEVSVWPAERTDRHALLCHRQYAEHQGHVSAVGCPLFDGEGKLRGAVLISSDTHLASHVLPFLSSAQRPLATALHLVHRAEQNRWWRRLRGFFTIENNGRRRAALMCVGVLSVLLCMPLRYSIKTTCRLEPSQERFLAAPFDGKLLRCHVEPGDEVEKDQLLAELDGQETQWELASVTAELQRAKKERVGHVASHDSGKARLAQYEIEYLESKSRLLTDRVSQLEVRSPIAGIVVSGDLTKAEGVPLEIGQTLFEIAPLDAMIAEISVPEDDVRFVKQGQVVKIRFDAFPYRPYETELRRVRPRSESRDDGNVFVADADVLNNSGQLRPGMEATVRIKTIRRPLGWILFHKPFAVVWTWVGL